MKINELRKMTGWFWVAQAKKCIPLHHVLNMIEQELHHAIDKHTRELVVSHIELLLNYSLRFYDRQFITREEINHSVVKKFLSLLDEYISDKAEHKGVPTVAYFADKCCLSTGYFGTLVKTETGRTAKDLINDRILAKAKEYLQSDVLSVSQISQRLGFNIHNTSSASSRLLQERRQHNGERHNSMYNFITTNPHLQKYKCK